MRIEIHLMEAWGDGGWGDGCTDERGAAAAFLEYIAAQCRERWPEAKVSTRVDDICGGPRYSGADVRAEEGEDEETALDLEYEIEETLGREWNRWYEEWVTSPDAEPYYADALSSSSTT